MGYFSEEDLENQYKFDRTYCPPELELFFYIEDLYDKRAILVAEARFREYGLEYSGQMPGESRCQWVRRVVLEEEPDEFVKVHQIVFPEA